MATLADVIDPDLNALARSRLKAWLEASDVTQAALADQIGRNQPWMSRYLKGEIDADVNTLHKMAKVFGHTLATLTHMSANPRDAMWLELIWSLTPSVRKALEVHVRHLARRRTPDDD